MDLLVLGLGVQLFGVQYSRVLAQLKCETEILFVNLYGHEFAKNGDGIGKLGNFVCELLKHNAILEQVFPPEYKLRQLKKRQNNGKTNWGEGQKNSKMIKQIEFLKQSWHNVKHKDAKLAECFETLRRSYNEVANYGMPFLETTKKPIIETLILLANRMEISFELIIPRKKEKETLEELKELAKLWAQMKMVNEEIIYTKEDDDEEKRSENGEKKEQKKGEKKEKNKNKNEECWKSEDKENGKKMLRLIWSIIDNGNIMALNTFTKNDSARFSSRRRRKRQDMQSATNSAIIVLILLFMVMFYFACCCESSCECCHNKNGGNIKMEIARAPTEILVKFRYGSNDFDKNSNRKTDHVYIVVGDYEYDYTTAGARTRRRRRKKNFPTKTFSFRPVLHIQGDPKRVSRVLKKMANGHWADMKSSGGSARLCIDFAYQFVCRLMKGICPPKEQWPNAFIEFDQRWVGNVEDRLSVFDENYRNSAQNCELSRDPPAIEMSQNEVINRNNQTATEAQGLTKTEEEEYPWSYAYPYYASDELSDQKK